MEGPHSTHQHLQQKEAAMTKQKLDGKREPAAPRPERGAKAAAGHPLSGDATRERKHSQKEAMKHKKD